MSNLFNSPLQLDLKPSKTLTAILITAHFGAMFCLISLPSVIAAIVLSTGLLFSSVYTVRRYAMLLSDRSIKTIIIQSDESLLISLHGETEEAQLLAYQTVNTGSMIVLGLATTKKMHHIPVFRDMLGDDVYRRLRVYLQTRNR